MAVPCSVQFHNIEKSEALEAKALKQAESLARVYDRITACHVTIDSPHQHHHRGRRYDVLIRISLPGDTLVVSHEGESNPDHENAYVTLRDAFRSARRQLKRFVSHRRDVAKKRQTTAKRKMRQELT